MINTCVICGLEFESLKPAKTCSAKCRVTLSRKSSVVTHDVTLAEIGGPEEEFEFYTNTKDRVTEAGTVTGEKSVRKVGKYWYDIPISAIPIVKEGWPKCPSYMNGRQYFLWWKNNFEVGKGEDPFGTPLGSYYCEDHIDPGLLPHGKP